MDKELLNISKFDAADYLTNDLEIQDYLDEVRSENAPQAFLQAINTVARAKGMAKVSRDIDILGDRLY